MEDKINGLSREQVGETFGLKFTDWQWYVLQTSMQLWKRTDEEEDR